MDHFPQQCWITRLRRFIPNGIGQRYDSGYYQGISNQICTSNLHDRLSIWLSIVYLDDVPIPQIHVFCSKIHWFIDDFSEYFEEIPLLLMKPEAPTPKMATSLSSLLSAGSQQMSHVETPHFLGHIPFFKQFCDYSPLILPSTSMKLSQFSESSP